VRCHRRFCSLGVLVKSIVEWFDSKDVTAALALALVVKVFSNSEDVNRSYRLARALVLVGTLLNTIGYVFFMECQENGNDDPNTPQEYGTQTAQFV